MDTFIIPLAIEVKAESAGDVRDDLIADAVMAFPFVHSIESLGVIKRDTSDGDRTVWADVSDTITP